MKEYIFREVLAIFFAGLLLISVLYLYRMNTERFDFVSATLEAFSSESESGVTPDVGKDDSFYKDFNAAGDYELSVDNVVLQKSKVLEKVEYSLKSGVPVIFATSELSGSWASTESKFIPYSFFKNELEIPVFAFGHAHAQALTVLAQLAAYSNEDLRENARVAFVISPGFFRTDGTNIESFLKYMPNELLKKLYFESDAPERVKVYISRYINKHFDKIENSGFIHRYAANYESASSLSILKNKFLYTLFDERVGALIGDATQPVDYEIDWDSYAREAKEISERISSNNPWGIRNDYFDSYVKEESKNATEKVNVAIPHWYEDRSGLIWNPANYESIEYADLKMLMEFCETLEIKPLFIMQDLNPYAYRNYEEHNFNMRRVKELVDTYGYHYLDLWSYSPDKYVMGTLVDLMHLGEYGWLQVDKAIYENLIDIK